jgi:predicted amino acid racemase
MKTPYLSIDLEKIEHNARTVTNLCAQHGIIVTGVTKAVCGNPHVAKAMLRGGVESIADSRLLNIRRMQTAGVKTRYMLLRVPALSEVNDVVEFVDISLNSELQTLQALSAAAVQAGKVHDVLVMVDLGDLREGLWPNAVLEFITEALKLPGIRIVGLGTNLSCFAGVMPSKHNMNQLLDLAHHIEQTQHLSMKMISGINSSGLELIANDQMPQGINHARIGEAILLGRETIYRNPWPDTYQDAFTLHAEIIELNQKPSLPIGKRSEDAFGNLPLFEDRGQLKRALLNVGREDIDVNGITPLCENAGIIGASSGYLGLDLTNVKTPLHVGDELSFQLNYGALIAAMTSEYVHKQFLASDGKEEF